MKGISEIITDYMFGEYYTEIRYEDGTAETWVNETEAGAIRFHKKIESEYLRNDPQITAAH